MITPMMMATTVITTTERTFFTVTDKPERTEIFEEQFEDNLLPYES